MRALSSMFDLRRFIAAGSGRLFLLCTIVTEDCEHEQKLRTQNEKFAKRVAKSTQDCRDGAIGLGKKEKATRTNNKNACSRESFTDVRLANMYLSKCECRSLHEPSDILDLYLG